VSTATTARTRGFTRTGRARSARTALHTAARASRAATALAGGAPLTSGTPLSLRFLNKEDKLFVPAAKTLFEYVYYCEGDVRKVNFKLGRYGKVSRYMLLKNVSSNL
jgi:hypothetical protein